MDRVFLVARQTHVSLVPIMTSYSLDVEMFISEVKKYPEIWDLNSEDNRYKSRKQHAWSEIAKAFIVDYEDMPAAEKMDVYRKLHGKWRNIRDSYVRHTKRKYGKKGYMYAKHLSFLNNLYKQNSQSGSEAEADQTGDWQSDSEEATLKKFVYKPRSFDCKNESSIWNSDAEDVPSTIDNLKRKRKSKSQQLDVEFVDTPFPEATCSYPVEDEDKSFFDSLLPVVREFNVDQKLEFRSDVISLIKSIRSNNNGRKFKLDPITGDFDS